VTAAPFAPLVRPAAARPSSTVDAATRCRRWLRLAGSLAGTAARSVRTPLSSARGRRRLAVCGAARALTALGVRVRVLPTPVAWPRTGPGHLVLVADRMGWLAGLALLTAVPGTRPGGPPSPPRPATRPPRSARWRSAATRASPAAR